MSKQPFGVIGLGVMGRNLALNVADHGFPVVAWNLEPEVTDAFVAENAAKGISGTRTLAELVAALPRPRRILVMIKAGAPVDSVLEKLAPLLAAGDVVIDGGNSLFQDTRRREGWSRERGFLFVGVGVSGGEDGARFGPSLMPGGDPAAYENIKDVLEAIAARTSYGACVTHIGPDGAGHFVKMVHNGIEYGDMQLIAEAYAVMERLGMTSAEIGETFARWNEGPLESFLIEITAKIFAVKDATTGRPLVELVQDKAGQKGTGKWTAQVALDLGVSIPTIAAAIDARVLSSMKAERVAASARLAAPSPKFALPAREGIVKAIHDALYAAKICSYAQGMSLIRAGSAEYRWNINLAEVARIWTGGCIIRARFLASIMRAFQQSPALPSLLLDEEIGRDVTAAQPGWRQVVGLAVALGVPVPALSASLAYFDSYRSARLPQNLTQAQRDAFGAHTYERTDRPDLGFIHTDWI
jgi:6-phosphogluconate dehydrogenase